MSKHPLDPYTYILVDRKLVNCPNDNDWYVWFGNMKNRRVAKDVIGDTIISTIFGGIDRSYGREPHPQVFETHIFGGEHDDWEEFSASWSEAETVHAKAVALVKGHGTYPTKGSNG
jgi:hypothetical protein